MKEIVFSKDQLIFRQGEFQTVMYDIIRGQVGIYTDYGTEKEQQVAVLGDGQCFGEMGMIEYYPRSATAVALEETVAEELGESDLEEYFQDKPEKLLQLMKTLSRRLRETTQKYVDICRSVNAAQNEGAKLSAMRDLTLYTNFYNFFLH